MTERILYTWIHISDIHFGHGGPDWSADQKDVVSKLVTDVRVTLDVAGAPSADALIMTGDIAFAGVTEEFDRARQLVRDIIEASGGTPRVLAVAGNHDVVRTKSEDLDGVRLLERLRDGTEPLTRVLGYDPDREKLGRQVHCLPRVLH